MNIYILLVLFLCFFSILFYREKDHGKQLFCSFILLFIIMGFREARLIGNDSATSYLNHYINAMYNPIDMAWNKNVGFYILFKCFAANNIDYQVFLIFEAAFVCYAYGRLLKKYSPDPFISILWFLGMLYYTLLFSALKQAFAMALVCFAFDAMMQKKIVRYLVYVVLAMLFHFPAIVFLPAYWLVKMKIDKHFLFTLFIAFVLVFIFRERILNLANDIYYGEGSGYTYSSNAKFLGTKVILMVFSIVVGVLLRKPDYRQDSIYTSILMIMCFAAVFQTFCYYNNIFERMADYYYQFSILFIPMIFDSRKRNVGLIMANESSTITSILFLGRITIIAFCIFNFLIYVLNNRQLSPFVFFWQY